MSIPRRRLAVLSTLVLAVTGSVTAGFLTASPALAATGCRVDYTISSQWPSGFTAGLNVTNLGDPISAWTLKWSFGASQTISSGWNATFSQSGSTVTATNLSYNASLATGASTSIGFNGTWNNSTNPTPANFTLNGVACTGTTSTATPSTTPTRSPSPSPTGTPSSTPSPQPTGTLVGWATQNGGTTGGAGGSTVTVTTASALDTALTSTSALNIRISGMISLTGMHKVASNKTITGVGSSSGLTGGGLNVSSASNVIIRNLVFRNADDDSINVQASHNVWIDHNDLANGYDGLTDIKHGSDFITVSWNHFHDHDKNALLGHSDDNAAEDTGHLRVTYHHNWFDATVQRNPRVRFGNPVHVFNNYYNGNSGYGVASTCNAGVLVEGNYFENLADTYHLGEASSPAGSLVARNNYFVNASPGQTGGTVASIPYAYSVDTPSGVKASVTANSGTGKIGL